MSDWVTWDCIIVVASDFLKCPEPEMDGLFGIYEDARNKACSFTISIGEKSMRYLKYRQRHASVVIKKKKKDMPV